METTRLKSASLAINGTISVAIGMLFIFLSEEMFDIFVTAAGAALSLAGFIMLVFTYFHNKQHGVVNVAFIIQGVLNLAVGITMITQPDFMLHFIFFGIGLWTLAIGFFQIIYALQVRKIVNSGIYLLVNGIVFAGIGAMLIVNYQAMVHSLIMIVGIMLSLLGFILLYFSLIVHKHNSRLAKAAEESKNSRINSDDSNLSEQDPEQENPDSV